MVTQEGKMFFQLLKLPLEYNINKELLKKNYFQTSKHSHPDIKNNSLVKTQGDIKLLNKAYSTLNDDFNRAKLFTKPSKKLNSDFLETCLTLEERILQGEDLKTEIEKNIEECKKEYKDPYSVGKWAYFNRLLEKISKV